MLGLYPHCLSDLIHKGNNDQVYVYESRKQKFQSEHFHSASFILINQLLFFFS